MQANTYSIKAHSHPGLDLQRPFDAAVVIQTLVRDTLPRAVRSICDQNLDGFIQILIGIDDPKADRAALNDLIGSPPPNIAFNVFDPGYSTFTSNGGLHRAYGGALRTILSYAANSRYVAYLDDDNWWAPDHLTSLITAIEGYDWAFSLRNFVDPETGEVLATDDQESVGPGGGIFKERFDGFVDASSLIIDKLACEPALRLWSVPMQADGKGEDRTVFDLLKRNHPFNCTFRPTSYYTIDRRDPVQPHRAPFFAAVAEQRKSGNRQTARFGHLPGRIRQAGRQWLLRHLPKNGVGAEIGVWRGDFSALLLNHTVPTTLHLIDPWVQGDATDNDAAAYGGKEKDGQVVVDEAFDHVCQRYDSQVSQGQIVIHRKTSAQAAATFEDASLDWVYVDGDRHYEQVFADLCAYLPKIKVGGMIAGDDSNGIGRGDDGVRRALEDFLYRGGAELVRIAGDQFVLRKLPGAPQEPMNPSLSCRREPTVLSIKGKFRRDPFAFANPHDFKFDIDRTISVADLVQRKSLSLYCLDDQAKQFFFVESPDARALETAPFIYQRQFEQAEGLFAVPYECLADIASPMESPPIFILSIGRVGSTLLSSLFNAIPEVRSFSEPDVFTQIANLRNLETRNARGKRDAELVKLIETATRCLQPAGGAGHHRRLVIKHRSQVCALSELFVAAFPEARIIFIHREAESWARSAVRAFGYNARQLAALWRNGASAYERLSNSGANILNLGYEEMESNGLETFRRILDFCAIALPADTGAIEATLGRDSQEGTTIGKSRLDSIDRDVDSHVQQFLKEISGEPVVFGA